MSLSTKTLFPTTASATATTTVEASDALPHNCHTIIIYNPDTTNDVYVAEATASGTPLSDTSSSIIKAGAYLTLTIGARTTRVSPTTTLGYSTSSGSISVNITYVCSNVV